MWLASLLWLAACSTPQPPAPRVEAAPAPAPASAPVADNPAPAEPQGSARILPQDVQDYIVRRRLCLAMGGKTEIPACRDTGLDTWQALYDKHKADQQATVALEGEKPATSP